MSCKVREKRSRTRRKKGSWQQHRKGVEADDRREKENRKTGRSSRERKSESERKERERERERSGGGKRAVGALWAVAGE